MSDLALYLLRLLQYLSLMLLFGLPLLQWQADRTMDRTPSGASWFAARPLQSCWLPAWLGIAVVMQCLDAPLKTMRILGLSWSELDADAFGWYLLETPAGLAWIVRTALLLAIAGLLWSPARRHALGSRLVGLLAGAALMTLLWNGHAAASEGTASALRLTIGGLHLLAAAAWLGAIAGFLQLLAHDGLRRGDVSALSRLHVLLHTFSGTGTWLVLILLATGLPHYAWIMQWQWSPSQMLATPYGRWMLVKLLLFAGMLVLAALHRWVLVPRLQRARDIAAGVQAVGMQATGMQAKEPQADDAVVALRRSLRLEACAALLVVAAVAVLGTMSPHA